jgi:N-methylhydantoinase A
VTYADAQGYTDCITMDMGGTSFDAALMKNKEPFVTTVGEIDRLRLALPMLNVVTIGAGGGSVGWIDEGGLLRMGPQSAGAKPGPACYGLGGDRPTCTDADLVLGYLDPAFFAGGRMDLDVTRARTAIEEHVAGRIGMTVEEAAAGMYDVINTNMSAAVRELAVKHGEDPRDFPLLVAGGAGPNHACMIALELECPVLIIPRESSIFCAAGMLMSDLKHNYVRTYATILGKADPVRFSTIFSEMAGEGRKLLVSENVPHDRIDYIYQLDLRYRNQYHEVTVDVDRPLVEACDFQAMEALFHPEHNRLFGYSLEDEGTPVELINMRLQAVGRTDKPRFAEQAFAGPRPKKAKKGSRSVYLPRARKFAKVDVYDAFALRHGNRIRGPAILEQVNTTTFVSPEFDVLVDRWGSYTLFLKEKAAEVEERILGKKGKMKAASKPRPPVRRSSRKRPTSEGGSASGRGAGKKKAPARKKAGKKKKAPSKPRPSGSGRGASKKKTAKKKKKAVKKKAAPKKKAAQKKAAKKKKAPSEPRPSGRGSKAAKKKKKAVKKAPKKKPAKKKGAKKKAAKKKGKKK